MYARAALALAGLPPDPARESPSGEPAGMNDNEPRPSAGKIAVKPGRRSEREMRAASRLQQIGKLIGVRYGGPCNDNDAAVYYEAALPCLVEIAAERGRLDRLDTTGWLRWCAPSLVPNAGHDPDRLRRIDPAALRRVRAAERLAVNGWRRHLASDRAAYPYVRGSRGLGRFLRVRAAEIRAGNIRFLSPIDRTAEQLADERRDRDAAYRRMKRDREGVQARTSSAQALQLWTVLGIGRRTFYKLRKGGALPDLPVIPRGADPAPYLAAFASAYQTGRQEPTQNVPRLAA